MKAFLLTDNFGKKFLDAVVRSIYPNKCLFCRKVLDDKDAFVCSATAHSGLAADLPESFDAFEIENLDKVYAAYKYEGLAADCIVRFKYNGIRSLAKPIARAIFESTTITGGDFIVPVPLYPSRLKARGYNQSAELGLQLASLLNIPIYDGLERIRNTAKQAGLSAEERIKNLSGAIAVKSGFDVKDKHVVLADDILTTGSTAAECGRILKEAGAKQVDLVVFARTLLMA
jgi:ComF family protein